MQTAGTASVERNRAASGGGIPHAISRTNWCERIQRPPKLRVYAFKNYEAFYRVNPLADDWVPQEPPDPGDYKLWFEGYLYGMDASALCRRARRMPLAKLCGVVVHCGHLVEIDDNIAPVLLCQTRKGLVRVQGFQSKDG